MDSFPVYLLSPLRSPQQRKEGKQRCQRLTWKSQDGFPPLKGRQENRSISTLEPGIWERMLTLEKLGGSPLASCLLQQVKGLTSLIRCNMKSER